MSTVDLDYGTYQAAVAVLSAYEKVDEDGAQFTTIMTLCETLTSGNKMEDDVAHMVSPEKGNASL